MGSRLAPCGDLRGPPSGWLGGRVRQARVERYRQEAARARAEAETVRDHSARQWAGLFSGTVSILVCGQLNYVPRLMIRNGAM